jgi:hypothetical protein
MKKNELNSNEWIAVDPPLCMMVDVNDTEERTKLFNSVKNVLRVGIIYPKAFDTDEEGKDVEVTMPLGRVAIKSLKSDDTSMYESNIISVLCVAKKAGSGSIVQPAFKMAIRNAIVSLKSTGIFDKDPALIYITNNELEPHAIYEYSASAMAMDVTEIVNSFEDIAANITVVVATDPSTYPTSLFDIDDDDDLDEKKKKKKKKNKKKKK